MGPRFVIKEFKSVVVERFFIACQQYVGQVSTCPEPRAEGCLPYPLGGPAVLTGSLSRRDPEGWESLYSRILPPASPFPLSCSSLPSRHP